MPIKFLKSIFALLLKPTNVNLLSEIQLYAVLKNPVTEQFVMPTEHEMHVLGITEVRVMITCKRSAPIMGGKNVTVFVTVQLFGSNDFPVRLLLRLPRRAEPIIVRRRPFESQVNPDAPMVEFMSDYFIPPSSERFSATLEIHALT